MNIKETKQILMKIETLYPNFRVSADKVDATASIWQRALNDYSLGAVEEALNDFIREGNGFPPSVGNLIPKNHTHGYSERIYSDEFFEELERESTKALIKGRGYK